MHGTAFALFCISLELTIFILDIQADRSVKVLSDPIGLCKQFKPRSGAV